MKYADINSIKTLINRKGSTKAISIFIPTHKISLPHNLLSDRIRFKNAIRETVDILEKIKTPADEIKQYKSKLLKLQSDKEFWKHRDNGLAIYLQLDQVEYFDLPIEVKSSVHLSDNFIITPLLVAHKDRFSYNLLVLNSHEPKFYLASQSGIERVLKNEMPGIMSAALRIDENQMNLQHGTAHGGSHDGMHHGHGGEDDNKAKDTEKYYRLIDSIIWKKVLNNSSAPLIIAGDRRSTDMYKRISRYKFIEAEIIEGSHEHTPETVLHRMSWEIMGRRIDNEESMFLSLIRKLQFHDKRQILISGDQIKRAAKNGRVATLAISIVHKTYDSVIKSMEEGFKIALPASKRSLENIESAARDVINTGGEVKALLYSDSENRPMADQSNYLRAIVR